MAQNPYVQRFRTTPATFLILIANVGWFLLAELNGSTLTNRTLIEYGATYRELIWAGEYWRLLSSVFLHIGWIHLLWNSYVMFGLDQIVEKTFGTWRFLVMYLVAGIGGSAVSVIGHEVVGAGASGAGFGMIGVVLSLFYRRLGSLDAFLSDRNVRQNLMILLLWSVLGHFMGFDNYAHFGGLFFGGVLGLLFTASDLRGRPLHRIAAFSCVGLALTATVVGAVVPWKFLYESDGARVTHQEALDLIGQGDLQKALEQLDLAEREGDRSYELYYNRALVKNGLDDPEGAEEDLGKAIEQDSIRFKSYLFRSELRRQRDDSAGARADLLRVLELAPKKWQGREDIEAMLQELEKAGAEPNPEKPKKEGKDP